MESSPLEHTAVGVRALVWAAEWHILACARLVTRIRLFLRVGYLRFFTFADTHDTRRIIPTRSVLESATIGVRLTIRAADWLVFAHAWLVTSVNDSGFFKGGLWLITFAMGSNREGAVFTLRSQKHAGVAVGYAIGTTHWFVVACAGGTFTIFFIRSCCLCWLHVGSRCDGDEDEGENWSFEVVCCLFFFFCGKLKNMKKQQSRARRVCICLFFLQHFAYATMMKTCELTFFCVFCVFCVCFFLGVVVQKHIFSSTSTPISCRPNRFFIRSGWKDVVPSFARKRAFFFF